MIVNQKNREVRVFVSSTFRDMNEERDYLNNIVFPMVEQYCKKRFLSFIPIDLRWGIPEEESRNGLVLSACLEEIDRSRPFFIGILGSRYGWNPKPSELNGMRVSLDQQEWVKKMASDGSSITEMEMEYGVLRDMDIPYARFFIRSDKVHVPVEFKEVVGSVAEERLKKLKHRIRNQQKYPVAEYDSIQQFGEMIHKQLIEMIELEYPLSGNEEEASMIQRQELALKSRSNSLFDLSRSLSFFNRWISGYQRFLLITGESGCGTSTVLANCVSELRKRCTGKVIYFDFEAIDIGNNPMDALLKYLSLEKLRVPDNQWGMIAIDNTSVLATQDEKRFVKWLKGLGNNIVVALTVPNNSDLHWEIGYSFGCPEIDIHSMSLEQKRDFIDNYLRQYGKRLTASQLEALSTKLKTTTIGQTESLLRLIANFGSFEQLDDRINELVKYSDEYWVFNSVKEDAIASFSKIKLDSLYINALKCISLVSNGIHESDLLAFAKITRTEWSLIEPAVRSVCMGSPDRLKFVSPIWKQVIKDGSTPYDMALIGRDMINWYLSDQNKWNRCAQIVNDIYKEIFGWGPELGNLEELVFAVAKSPDMIRQLKDSELAELWSHLSKKVSDNSVCVYGRSVEELPVNDAVSYYMRLAKIAKSLGRGENAAYCCVEISKIKEQACLPDTDFFRCKIALEQGHPETAVLFLEKSGILQGERKGWLTGRVKVVFTLEQQLRAHLLMFEACVMRGDWNKAVTAFLDFRSKADSEIETASGELKEIIVTGYSTFAYVLSGYYPKDNRVLAKELLQIVCKDSMKLELGHEATYLLFMATVCLFFLSKSYENMYRNAVWAVHSARFAFGERSYQFARAHLMCAFAHYQLEGDYGVPGNAIKNEYPSVWFADYYRSFGNKQNNKFEWDRIEIGVRDTLLKEYAFFWNTELAIQPTVNAQERLAQKMEEYKKRLGFR